MHDQPRARVTAVLLLIVLLAATPLAFARSSHDTKHAKAKKHRVTYCTARTHPHGCIAVPKAAHRPKGVGQQGSPSLSTKGSVDGGGLGSGPGVRNAAAVTWARGQRGSAIWAFRCELFVEQAYGTSDQFLTAWAAAGHVGLHHSPVTSAPAGALLYFAPDKINDGFGHTGISLGGGSMISALDTVQITNVTKSRYWSNLYRGWADAPSSWPGRIPPPPGSTVPLVSSAVEITAPAFNSIQGGIVPLQAAASNVSGVGFYAYYATDPSNARTVGWHTLGNATNLAGVWTFTWDTQSVPKQGNPAWGTVNVAAVALDAAGNATGTRDYRRISIDNSGPTLPTVTTPTVPTTPTTPTTPGTTTYLETTGGLAHTWTNYVTAGGTQGPSIPSNNGVQVSCKVAGFQVADGDTWWYRIASPPWNSAYYVSADAFYNNGNTSGSLVGTPFVDPVVPNC